VQFASISKRDLAHGIRAASLTRGVLPVAVVQVSLVTALFSDKSRNLTSFYRKVEVEAEAEAEAASALISKRVDAADLTAGFSF
jgi:hypothetical protein